MTDEQAPLLSPAPDLPDTSERRPGLKVFLGFITAIVLDVVVPALLAAIGAARMNDFVLWTLLLFGLTQWIWLAPLVLFTRSREQTSFSKGVLIAGSIVTLLNAACWGLIALK